jgi:ribosomal protein L37AE/L43A
VDTPVLKVQCPACGAKQVQKMKSIVQPDSNNIHACTKCQSPMPSGETALLLTMMRDTRRTAKWVAFMGVVVAIGAATVEITVLLNK